MANELQRIYLGSQASPVLWTNAEAGTLTLNYDGQPIVIQYNDSEATILAAFEGASNIGSGNVTVTKETNAILAEFIGALANTNVPEITITPNTFKPRADTIDIDEVQPGIADVACVPSINTTTTNVEGVQEVQEIAISEAPTSGSLVINGITVDGFNSFTAADVEAAIETGGGANKPCAVTGSQPGPFTVTYDADEDVSDSLLSFTGSTLAKAASITHGTTQEGDIATNEIQTIQTDADGGLFSLFVNDPISGPQSTSSLNFNATAAEVKAALEAVMTVGTVITCTGTLDMTMSVEFGGVAGLQNIDQMTSGSMLTIYLTVTVNTTTQGVTPISQIDTITFDTVAVAGTMTIDGDSLDWNVPALGTVTITGSVLSNDTPASGAITVTWDDDQPHMTVTVATGTLKSVAGQHHIFTIELSDGPTSGKFTPSVDAVQGGAIDFDDTAGEVTYAFNPAGPPAYSVTASGADGGPWTVESDNNDGPKTITAVDGVDSNALRKALPAETITVDQGGPDGPTISSLTPADDATGVSQTANLVIVFSVAVDAEAGAANNIDIYLTSDDSLVESIDSQDAKVTGTGTDTITINPAATLDKGVGYYVLIGPDAFDDASSNSFAGISSTTEWNFTVLTTVPGVPTSPTATAISSSRIDLSWTEPADNGGASIGGYKIERESPIGGGFSTLVADTGSTATTYSDTGLTAETEYNYRFSAINAVGVGAASSEADATTDAGGAVPSRASKTTTTIGVGL